MGTERCIQSSRPVFFSPRVLVSIDRSTMRRIVMAFRPLTFDKYEAQCESQIHEVLQDGA